MSNPNQQNDLLPEHQDKVGDDWELTAKVAQGGSAHVYKADLTEKGRKTLALPPQQAAVKILMSDGTTDRERFRRELDIARALGGDYCPKLLDYKV